MSRNRRGFALITVLWVVAVAAAMAGAAALTGRNAVSATRNRTQLTRAYWSAIGCVARVRAAIDSSLDRSDNLDAAEETWRLLDHAVSPTTLPMADECQFSLEAAGTRLDVNAASDEMAANLFRALGYDDASSALMVDALADWRDSDSAARPEGAESAWYEAASRALPRNGDIADVREISRIRGFEDFSKLDSVISVDAGRISLATAPFTVLMSIPGFTPEAAQKVVSLRDEGTPLPNLLSLLSSVSESSRELLLSRYPDIARLTTTDPDAWLLTVRGKNGLPPTRVVLRLRLQREGKHAVVVEGRSTI